MSGVASGTRLQSQGISRVSTAVAELGQTTRLNAEGAATSNATAESLIQAATQLSRKVGLFRLAADASATPASQPKGGKVP
jgi:methyl-accepting chemotaxis protein